MKHVLVVGAGLTGAALARILSDTGTRVTVIDERDHVAGNCFSRIDPATGIMRHEHGPHIFHTNSEEVWAFVNRFAEFKPYIQRTKVVSRGGVYSLPVNLMTINQLFGRTLSPAEAEKFIASQADASVGEASNFEEQALAFLGERLYRAFFHGYTRKQWGCEPRELPADILKRLPVRFNYDDNYFNDHYQAIPALGYTAMVENMLDGPGVEIRLGQAYRHSMKEAFDHVFYSGRVDRYFEYRLGRLPYRTLDFEWFTERGDYQGCAVMNYADVETPYTRIVEHKHFTYWTRHDDTICAREYSRAAGEEDIPYYPVRFAAGNALLQKYQELARAENRVTFVGRLGAFQYLDMDKALYEAMREARQWIS